MKPAFRLSSLKLDPLEWRVSAEFTDEATVISAHFPFRPEYDMPFGRVRELAEQRALELFTFAPTEVSGRDAS
ncbi:MULTISPECIES: hypothetical protein [unclassified Brevundimonas]|uniref:hypothetical protein n=1 Tax=unclassified Brevundimonas TaxID=2622653 RepID=UPI003F8EFEF9